jgi:MFS family permease
MVSTTQREAATVATGASYAARQHRDFLKLWAGETISLLGSQVTALALPLVAVITLHASAVQVGILNAFRYAPFVVVTLIAGVLVDRVRRRPTMIVANAARAGLIVLVPAATFFGWLRVEYLYAVGFAVGVFTVFFDLAYQAYLPALVERRLLTPANSRLQMSASAAELGGPGLGGLLVQALTAPYALMVDAASYLVSIVSLVLIKQHEPEPPHDERPPLVAAVRSGFRFTFRNAYLRAIAGEAATYNLFEQTILTAFVVYAIRQLHFSAGLLGVVISTGAAGGLAGAFVSGRLERRFGFGRTTVGSMVVGCVVPLLIAVPAGSRWATAGALMIVFFVWGAGIAVSNVLVVSLRQTVTPDAMLGRMNASYRFFTFGAIPLGALLAGALAAMIGLRGTLLAGALGLLLALAWVVFSPVASLEALPAGPEDPVPESQLVR